jgi:hypothetical protein
MKLSPLNMAFWRDMRRNLATDDGAPRPANPDASGAARSSHSTGDSRA